MRLDLITLIFGEGAYISGLILQFYTLLVPTPWFGGKPGNSILHFSPYFQPPGYVPPNPCLSQPLSNITVDTTIPLNGRSDQLASTPRFHRALRSLGGAENEELSTRSNADAYSNIAIWMGPLGTCTRDQDMRIFCTKSSYSSPVYNLTHVQPNSVYYESAMPKSIKRRMTMGMTVVSAIAVFLHLLSAASYWFPGLFSYNVALSISALTGAFLFIAGWPTFFLNFNVEAKNIKTYNSIDNFYDPAPCNSARPLKSGVLLKASGGLNYKLFWVGWVFIFAIAGLTLLVRMTNLQNVHDIYHMDKVERAGERQAKKEAKQLKKEEKKEQKFRDKVEKEKDRIRRVAREEIELEEGKGEETDSKLDPPSYEKEASSDTTVVA